MAGHAADAVVAAGHGELVRRLIHDYGLTESRAADLALGRTGRWRAGVQKMLVAQGRLAAQERLRRVPALALPDGTVLAKARSTWILLRG